VELYQIGELHVWQEVPRWLARMHCRMEPRAALLHRPSHADWSTATAISSASGRRGHGLLAPEQFGEKMVLLQRMIRRYDRVLSGLSRCRKRSFTANSTHRTFLWTPTIAPIRICPVDWEWRNREWFA